MNEIERAQQEFGACLLAFEMTGSPKIVGRWIDVSEKLEEIESSLEEEVEAEL